MKVEEFRKLSRKELQAKANQAFALAEARGQMERPGQLAEAEFYVRELDHRADSRVSTRDLVLEIVVIALIGWEIHMGYRQEHEQSQQFEKQQAVLSNLEKSSAATVGAMTAARSTMETMNASLQKQLALYYDVSMNIGFDPDKKELTFINNGRTNIALWGTKAEK